MATKFNDLYNGILKENIPTQAAPNQQASLQKAQQEIDNLFKTHGNTTDPNIKAQFITALANKLDAYVKETQKQDQQATAQNKTNVPQNTNQTQTTQQNTSQPQTNTATQQTQQTQQSQPTNSSTPPKFPIK